MKVTLGRLLWNIVDVLMAVSLIILIVYRYKNKMIVITSVFFPLKYTAYLNICSIFSKE
mgnify:CR=1 FL=1